MFGKRQAAFLAVCSCVDVWMGACSQVLVAVPLLTVTQASFTTPSAGRWQSRDLCVDLLLGQVAG